MAKKMLLSKNSMTRAESKEANRRRVRVVVNQCPSIGSQNRAVVYRCRRRKPPSLYKSNSHACLPIFNYGFSKGAGPKLNTKEKKNNLRMCSRFILKIAGNKERHPLHLPILGIIRFMKITTVSRYLQVTRNKEISNFY